ncbi:MAG: CRISPR-associated endonuclease Cas3'' [Marinobacter sp.]|uniref:CRISPR-associated endonuclease Cas3'' n=1 Tax=Marinobacter sp. TaxID=50741 RepID=UPI003F992FA1
MTRESIYVAHAAQDANGTWLEPHLLHEHLEKVARISARFARQYESQGWAFAAGLWHDLGKYRHGFQAYIRDASGFERENARRTPRGCVD